ncbi:hypothetical protein AMECASPLE_015901 [Ameca splendens]|uniref:PLC-beta PH domain-containing protein n=1 Tax=Ameca splendens TaxID=208324 RepID=A0ABV0XQU1_9TELE
MASAQPGVHALKLQPPCVSHTLRNGSNFIKWDEDLSTVTPVTLHVDAHGFYLFWTDQSKIKSFHKWPRDCTLDTPDLLNR